MDFAVPTGIVEEFPSPTTGKIVGSNAFKDILALPHPIPGAEGYGPSVVSRVYAHVIASIIGKRPSLKSKGFESRNQELFLIVDVPDEDAEYYKSKRWKARLVIHAKGIDTHYRIDSVIGVSAFWLEELKDGQVP